jgi:superfamily II DNA/RNA helicase
MLLMLQVKGSDIPAPLKHWSDLEKPFKQRHRHTPEQQQQHKPGSKASKAAAAAAAAAGADEDGHTDTLIIPHKLLSHLSEHGWHTPTPIQRQAVTALLGQRELLAVAPTGGQAGLLCMRTWGFVCASAA